MCRGCESWVDDIILKSRGTTHRCKISILWWKFDEATQWQLRVSPQALGANFASLYTPECFAKFVWELEWSCGDRKPGWLAGGERERGDGKVSLLWPRRTWFGGKICQCCIAIGRKCVRGERERGSSERERASELSNVRSICKRLAAGRATHRQTTRAWRKIRSRAPACPMLRWSICSVDQPTDPRRSDKLISHARAALQSRVRSPSSPSLRSFAHLCPHLWPAAAGAGEAGGAAMIRWRTSGREESQHKRTKTTSDSSLAEF